MPTYDEIRRIESDTACIDFDTDDTPHEWVDEDGYDRTPGQWPREVGLP